MRDGDQVLASHEVTLEGGRRRRRPKPLMFNAGVAGPQSFQFAIDPLPGEENLQEQPRSRGW